MTMRILKKCIPDLWLAMVVAPQSERKEDLQRRLKTIPIEWERSQEMIKEMRGHQEHKDADWW
jgi:hypothetical protein